MRAFPLSLVSALSLVASSSLLPLAIQAETTVATDPVGFATMECPGNSDTYVSIPLVRPAEFTGAVASISGAGGRTINFSGTPFTAGSYVYVAGTQPKTYYAFVTSGTKEGYYYTVTANTANSLTLDLAGDTISSISDVAQLSIIPYWTLGTFFPSGKGVNPSSGFTRATEVYIPDDTTGEVNKVPAPPYYYSASTAAWLQFGVSGVKNDVILYPDTYFIVRHNVATSTTLAPLGAVVTKKLVIPLAASSANKSDNYVALLRPVPVSLDNSGLISSGAFSASSGFTRTDELYVYDNTAVGKNKTPTIYYYSSGAWQKFGDTTGTTDFGATQIFTPGTGVVIRKAMNANSTTTLWVNSPTYSGN